MLRVVSEHAGRQVAWLADQTSHALAARVADIGTAAVVVVDGEPGPQGVLARPRAVEQVDSAHLAAGIGQELTRPLDRYAVPPEGGNGVLDRFEARIADVRPDVRLAPRARDSRRQVVAPCATNHGSAARVISDGLAPSRAVLIPGAR